MHMPSSLMIMKPFVGRAAPSIAILIQSDRALTFLPVGARARGLGPGRHQGPYDRWEKVQTEQASPRHPPRHRAAPRPSPATPRHAMPSHLYCVPLTRPGSVWGCRQPLERGDGVVPASGGAGWGGVVWSPPRISRQPSGPSASTLRLCLCAGLDHTPRLPPQRLAASSRGVGGRGCAGDGSLADPSSLELPRLIYMQYPGVILDARYLCSKNFRF